MEQVHTAVRPEINYNSPEWQIVEEWLADELLYLYKRIADIRTEDHMTNFYRGQASMIERMLDLRNAGVVINDHA